MMLRFTLAVAVSLFSGRLALAQGQMKVSELNEFCTSQSTGLPEACRFYIFGITEGASIAAGAAHDNANFCVPAGVQHH